VTVHAERVYANHQVLGFFVCASSSSSPGVRRNEMLSTLMLPPKPLARINVQLVR
jgi:hypothetical protein